MSSYKLKAIILHAKSVTGTLSAVSIVYYGHWYRRRPWSKVSFLLIAPIAYAVGTFPGAIAQVPNELSLEGVQTNDCGQMLAIRRFRRDLEDPNGLLEALGRRVRLVAQTARETNQVQASYPSSFGDPDTTPQSDNQGNCFALV